MSFVLYRKPDPSSVRPFAALYIVFFALSFLTINTYYLVFFEVQYRYYLWSFLALGYLVSIFTDTRYRAHLDLAINILALAFFAYFFRDMLKDLTNFGSILGQLLAVLLVLRSYILFSRDDFFVPFVISLTIMLLCSIPSYESNYVISLQVYFFVIVACLYLLSKSRELDDTRMGYFELEKLRKQYKFKAEMKMLVVLGIIALILASAAYLAIPHDMGIRRTYESQLKHLFGDRFNNPNGPRPEMEPPPELHGPSGRPQTYVGFQENSFNITTGRRIYQEASADETVLEVQCDIPVYMRAIVWDIYENGQWKRSGEIQKDYEVRPAGEPFYSARLDNLTYEFPAVRPISIDKLKMNRYDFKGKVFLVKRNLESSYIFTPWQTTSITFDEDPNGLWFNSSDWEIKLSPTGDKKRYISGIKNLKSYNFVASKYLQSGTEAAYLKEFPGSQAFIDRYTQLPENVNQVINGKTVKQLAEKIARDANAATNYEKTVAVLNYLKSVGQYSLDTPICPPEYDPIAYILLEVEPKRGHCEIFSSAMAVLLRSLGIPCREVTGYSPGTYTFNRNSYVIKEKNAHAWLEVFFPEIGWIEFDPTPDNLWLDVRTRMGEIIASASSFINELYVYSPKQFYESRVVPFARKTSSLINYYTARIAESVGSTFNLQRVVNFVLAIVIIAAVLAIILIIRKPKSGHETYQRISLAYYRHLVETFRRKGFKIASGDTPSEVIEAVSEKYPGMAGPLMAFLNDFNIINFAPSFLRKDAFRSIKSTYRNVLRKKF